MDTEVDLTTVDRDVLIAIIAELQAVIERLQRRIAELEGQVSRVNHICRFGVNQFCRFTSSAWPRCWAASVR